MTEGKRGYRTGWSSQRVRALRVYLRLSQGALAGELGVRQQTVSEWETGRYAPRGASARLLSLVAESAGFEYSVDGDAMGDG